MTQYRTTGKISSRISVLRFEEIHDTILVHQQIEIFIISIQTGNII